MPTEVTLTSGDCPAELDTSAVSSDPSTADVQIQSSNLSVSDQECTEEQLKILYDRQIPNFPEGCQNNVKSFLTNGEDVVHSTTVMQRHLMPALKTPGKLNKYVAPAAKYFMRKLEEKGIGDVEPSGKKAIQFRKRKWEELNKEALDILNICGITHNTYSNTSKKARK